MNGTWRMVAAAGGTIVLAIVSAAYGYGVLAADVNHNAQSIGKNEATMHDMQTTYQRRIEQLARDQAVTTQRIQNIQSGIAEVLRELKKR